MIPNPLDLIKDGSNAVSGWAWEKVASGIARWVLGAIGELINGILNFLKTSARADVTDAWFSGAGSPYESVRNVAAVLLVAFLLVGIISGLVRGDVAGMLRTLVADAPMAVLGMIATTVVVDVLLEITDSLSTAVLQGSDAQTVKFLEGFGVSATLLTGGFSAVVIGLVTVLAAVMIWIELMVRSSLIYLLVALSPLAFASSVWPAMRGVLRRLIELLMAVVVSKLAISIALAVGVAALGGAGSAAGPSPGVGEWAAQGLGTLIAGTAIICLAAFSPFVILKLIPLAEGAVIAQGMSRGPWRTAHTAMNTMYYAKSLGRLSGSGGGSGSGGSAGSGDAGPSPDFGPMPAGAGSGPGAMAGGAGSEGGGAGAVRGGASGGATAGASGAGSGAAAAGPAAIAVVAVQGAKTAKNATVKGVQHGADSVETSSEHGSGSTISEPPPRDPAEPFPGFDR